MRSFVLMDGGYVNEIKKYVSDDFQDHPLWICRFNRDNSDAIVKLCQDYIQAGSEIIVTNSYQATVDGMQTHWGLSKEECLDLIRYTVEICKKAIEIEKAKGKSTLVSVMGVVGPYGAYLHDGSEYTGGHYVDNMSVEELVEWHEPRIQALVEAGSDSLLFGTIPSVKEADALILLLKKYPHMKAILSFSAQEKECISHGEKFADVAQHCWESASDQLLAIGVNCQHPGIATPLVRSVRQAHPDIPLFIRPNTTEIFNTTTRQWEKTGDKQSLREYCREWLEMGVEYISGCCTTTSDDIRDFRQEIDTFINKQSH